MQVGYNGGFAEDVVLKAKQIEWEMNKRRVKRTAVY